MGEQTASLNKNLRHILFQAEKSVRHVRNVKPELWQKQGFSLPRSLA
jgi:hypothetical protein